METTRNTPPQIQNAGQYAGLKDNGSAQAQGHNEEPVASGIERQTAKLPSDLFLWTGLGSVGLALALNLSGRKDQANFVGHWAPTILILGLYNKLVRLRASDQTNVRT
jgi:hypothetical protein